MIGIEYMYAFAGKKSQQALVILRFEDPERASCALIKNNIKIISSKEVYEL